MAKATVDIGVIKSAVSLACRAPSLHNSQPWRWVVDGAALDLFADPDRIRLATDRSGREGFISCGVVCDHLAVAMAAAGWQAHINRFPNPNDPAHLASIDFSALGFVTDAQRDRAGAILQRRTDGYRSRHRRTGVRLNRCSVPRSTPRSRCSTSLPISSGTVWPTPRA